MALPPYRVDYSPIVDRPPIRWPGGARVAFWVSPNIEHYEYEPEFDAAMAELDPEFSNAHKNDDVGNDEDDTIADVIQKTRDQLVGVLVAPFPPNTVLRARIHGAEEPLDDGTTLKGANIIQMAALDIYAEG